MFNKFLKYTFFALGLATLISSCSSFENEIEFRPDDFQEEVVAECFLEANKPYRLVLSTTQNYFDSFSEFPFLEGATVMIEHNGTIDTLKEIPISLKNPNAVVDSITANPVYWLPRILPFVNDNFTKFYNYASTTVCSGNEGDTYNLKIITSDGKVLTSTTNFKARTILNRLRPEKIRTDEYSVLVYFYDKPDEKNYYRISFYNKPQIDTTAYQDVTFQDGQFQSSTDTITVGSPPFIHLGDTVTCVLYNMEKEYFDYLESLNTSIQNNGNPFASSSKIYGNINGGIGIFTALSIDKKQVIIEQ